MKTTVRIEGLKELDVSLGNLSKGVARGVLRRVLMKAGQPIADAARRLAPRDDGELANSIIVSSRVRNTTGNAEYDEVMRNFGTRQEATAAMIGARRAAKANGGGSFAQVYVGPGPAPTKADAIKRIAQEFGTAHHAPQPYMRPAWDQHRQEALDIITREMADEIDKAARRAARRAAKKAGQGK